MPAWGWVLISLGAVVVLCCAGGMAFFLIGTKGAKDATDAATADVRIAICAPDTSTGWARATVGIVNSDSRQHDYFVTVAFEEGGTQLGTGTVIINDLAAGQSAVDDAIALGKQASGFTCRITKVSRI